MGEGAETEVRAEWGGGQTGEGGGAAEPGGRLRKEEEWYLSGHCDPGKDNGEYFIKQTLGPSLWSAVFSACAREMSKVVSEVS